MSNGTIQIGDETLTITRFRGLKAMLAAALVGRVMKEIPEINEELANFRREYRKKNVITITRGMAKTDNFAHLGLTNEDFTDGPIELPTEPSQQEIFVQMFPRMWDLAQEELVRFLGLITIKNEELEAADDADEVEGALDKAGKSILRKATIDEVMELLVVGQEVLREQIMGKQERLGKLMDQVPFLRTLLSMPSPEIERDKTPQTSQDEQPTSSTTSAESTDGTDAQSSTESPGMSSSSSSPLTSTGEPQNKEPEKSPIAMEEPAFQGA